MTQDINSRLVKFNELVPSKVPFVEGKLKGHQDRLNYSIVGPGVSEDTKQNVKIAEEHGFNIGAVSAAPMNGSGLHSHTTAEVFLIFSGSWRFYWGTDGKEGEVVLNKGDVASFPTNMFRGFQNVSDENALIFVVLGENDPGVITWTPKVLEKAKESGMVLLNDNTLVDLDKNKIPDGKVALEPIKEKDLESFDHYTSEEIEKYVIRYENKDKYLKDDEHYNSNSILNYLDHFNVHNKDFEPNIDHNTGFGLTMLKGKNAHIQPYTLKESEVYLCLEGEWEVTCNDQKTTIGPNDSFSSPRGSNRSLKNISNQEGSIFIIRQKNL